MLKRYIVFAFNPYGPKGGWDNVVSDYKGVCSFDTIEEADAVADSKKDDFFQVQVVDLHTGQLVY